MAYTFDARSGVVIPDTPDIRETVATEWRGVLGQTLITTSDTPQGVMITAEALARQDVAAMIAAHANQINPNLAGGQFLDALCALTGITRRGAQASVIHVVELHGTPGTIVPAGSAAKSGDGVLWTLQSQVQIPTGGVAYGTFICSVTGPVSCPIGNLNEVQDVVLGWEAVVNTSPAMLGMNEESDASLASRRRVTLARQSVSTREAQISNLYDLDGVTSVAFRENVSASPMTIDGIYMAPHSIWACVDGSTDELVAATLLRQKTDGAGWNGAVGVTVRDPASGQDYSVKFDRPVYIYPDVEVTLKQGSDPRDPGQEVPLAIEKWAAGEVPGDIGLGLGVDVSPFEIAGAVNIANPGYFVTKVVVSLAGVVHPDGLAINLWQRAVISRDQVKVVLM